MRELYSPANANETSPSPEDIHRRIWPIAHAGRPPPAKLVAFIRSSPANAWREIYLLPLVLHKLHTTFTAHPTKGILAKDNDTWWIAIRREQPICRLRRNAAKAYGWERLDKAPQYARFIAMHHEGLFKLDMPRPERREHVLDRVMLEEDT